MTREDQQTENKRSIVIEIQLPGKTILPKSSEECFDLLRKESSFSDEPNLTSLQNSFSHCNELTGSNSSVREEQNTDEE